jgi:hypothetical protein
MTSHFFKSNGWNRIFFINSNASPKGLKISIFGSVPFMRGILNGFCERNQAAISGQCAAVSAARQAVAFGEGLVFGG